MELVSPGSKGSMHVGVIADHVVFLIYGFLVFGMMKCFLERMTALSILPVQYVHEPRQVSQYSV
jgi:hypothetical protein